jgi:hypothetical protein
VSHCGRVRENGIREWDGIGIHWEWDTWDRDTWDKGMGWDRENGIREGRMG